MSIRIISITRLYLTRIWKMYWMSVRVTFVCRSYLDCIWEICWMNVRMASVYGAYLNCIWKLSLNEYQKGIRVWSVSELYLRVESEWVSKWHPVLERMWTISWWWICMSIRLASVSEAYLNCIWELNEFQDCIRVWSVSELYLRAEFEWVTEWQPCLERICTVSWLHIVSGRC